jgi:hypothetical protein
MSGDVVGGRAVTTNRNTPETARLRAEAIEEAWQTVNEELARREAKRRWWPLAWSRRHREDPPSR